MADLLTKRELALWTQKSEAEVEADPFATEVIDKVSQMVQFLGGHPDWNLVEDSPDRAPFDVRMVVLQVCKRSYQNPRQVVQEGNVGPIGGDRILDVGALLLDLSETERKTITAYNPEGDKTADVGEVFVLKTTKGDPSGRKPATLYVSDNQQTNMHEGQSAWPSWDIPLFNPGDPGDPNLYDGEGTW